MKRTNLLLTLALFLLSLILSACGGDSGVPIGAVEPFYLANGAGWNDYIKNDGPDLFSASDVTCDSGTDGPGYDACIHGGEIRYSEVASLSSCSGITAGDLLGAFDWDCDDSTGTVRVISTGLRDGVHLSRLIDFSAPGWRSNILSVYQKGILVQQTRLAKWWGNPVVVNNDGSNGSDMSVGEVHIITTDPSAGYVIGASRVSLVIRPGVTLAGSASPGEFLVDSGSQDFIWVEGSMDVSGDSCGVSLDGTTFSVIDNVVTDGGGCGVQLLTSSNNSLSNITATSASNGISLTDSQDNTLTWIIANSNSSHGLYVRGFSDGNLLENITAQSNARSGIQIEGSSGNSLNNISVSGNDSGVALELATGNYLSNITGENNSIGVYLYQSYVNVLSDVAESGSGSINGVYLLESWANILSDITADVLNNGIRLDTASNNIISGLTAPNAGIAFYAQDSPSNSVDNITGNVDLYRSSGNILSNIISSGGSDWGVYVGQSSGNTFDNVLASNSAMHGIWVTGMSNSNTFNNVSANGNSDSGIYIESSDNNRFSNITANSNAGNGIFLENNSGNNTFSAVTTSNNTLSGINAYTSSYNTFSSISSSGNVASGIYLDGASSYNSFSNTSSIANGDNGIAFLTSSDYNYFTGLLKVGSNGAFDCYVWGAANPGLVNGTCDNQGSSDATYSTDSVLIDVLALPSGNATLTHTWKNLVTATVLRNAIEITGDGLGNENTLCESGETCLYTPNIGAYQGRGSLVSAGGFSDGLLTGITLLRYDTNP